MRNGYIPVLGCLALACGPAAPPELTSVQFGLEIENGTALNGTSFGGQPISAVSYLAWNRGFSYQFPIFAPSLTYDPFAGLGPNGDSLDGTQIGGTQLAAVFDLTDAAELIEAEVDAELADGRTVRLAVSGLAPGPAPNDDVLYFNMVVDNGQGWQPVCGVNELGEPIPALAVPGTWDLRRGHKDGGKWKHNKDKFTLACRGSSIAKCVEAGYKPWFEPDEKKRKKGQLTRSDFKKANHLQACVRMLRADYCNDGTSWTVDGRTIEFWDDLEYHTRERTEWTFEAAWSTDGLECLVEPRATFPDGKKPSCIKKLEKASKCNKFSKDTLLMSAFESQLLR